MLQYCSIGPAGADKSTAIFIAECGAITDPAIVDLAIADLAIADSSTKLTELADLKS